MRRPWAAVFAVMFFATWAGNQFSPLLLFYQERHDYSTTAVNAFLGVYVLGLVPAFLLGGALSDRYGRRPVMFVGVLAAVAASVALGFGETGAFMICLGRFFAGIAVGTATCVGASWMKELSQGPFDPGADATAGARRATLAFALGSATGAVLAGLIAEWGPWPEQLPFAIHAALTIPFAWLVLKVPETAGGAALRFGVPSARHRRFTRVVVVAAPWVLVAAAIGYGYLPVLVAETTPGWGTAYATLLTGVALASSSLAQPWVRRFDSPKSARGLLIGLVGVVAGIALSAVAVQVQSWPLGIAAASIAGAGMGIGMVSGLLEVQRIAGAAGLAGLTGVFYAVAYSGFLVPTALSAIADASGTPAAALLFALAGLGLVCALVVWRVSRRHLPGQDVAVSEGVGSPVGVGVASVGSADSSVGVVSSTGSSVDSSVGVSPASARSETHSGY
ncbi:MFS transporter [Glycomyces sp. NPDC046736]|uniref:MFS transporter n=1 Tax=Glycomyces sp. NPDC046736 TaxID=3155615 RepID=UPI0033E984FD